MEVSFVMLCYDMLIWIKLRLVMWLFGTTEQHKVPIYEKVEMF